MRFIDESGLVYHLIMSNDKFEYYTCFLDGSQPKSWQIVP